MTEAAAAGVAGPVPPLSAPIAERLAAAGLDPVMVAAFVRAALAEDLAGGIDVTTAATVPPSAAGQAELVARSAGIVAGLPVAEAVFWLASAGGGDPGHTMPGEAAVCRPMMADGDQVDAGQVVLTVSGPVAVILTAERTALNLLCHLSGVATLTRHWADAIAGTRARIRDTRKTLPGMRALQKYAVRCGGGVNHRMALSDAALVKDNHVAAAGSVGAAFAAVRACAPDLPVEVECDTLAQVGEALQAGADLILLDNFSMADLAAAVRLVGGRALLEASGGLTLAGARAVAETGVDYLAVGALTHSAPALDIGLDLVRAGLASGSDMLLTIDVGNTNTVLGVFDGADVVEHWRISTDPVRTADELAVLLQGLLRQSTLFAEPDVSGIALCSTVPSVLHELREMIRRYYGDVPAVIVEPGVKTGVPLRYDNPKEVGSDRIMNAVAAVHLYGGPAIVVDFGTSTNFDAVSERGEFVGGVLAPGIEISVDALSRRAAQLLKVELARPARVIGKSTVEALQSGIIYGFAGQVQGIATRMAAELAPADPKSVTVIATGGLAPLVIDEVSVIDAYEPWLTLIGLRLTYERNTADRHTHDRRLPDRQSGDRHAADGHAGDRHAVGGHGTDTAVTG